MSECVFSHSDSLSVVCEDRTGKCIRRSLVAEIHRLDEFLVVIDINRENGCEDLFFHRYEVRIKRFDDGRLNEVSFFLVAGSADEDLSVFRFLCDVDVVHRVVEAVLVDDCAHVVSEIGYVADFDRVDHVAHSRFDLRPERLRNIHSRSCRAFLALIFERTADCRNCDFVNICRAVDEYEVLAACFADYSRI